MPNAHACQQHFHMFSHVTAWIGQSQAGLALQEGSDWPRAKFPIPPALLTFTQLPADTERPVLAELS